MSAPERVSVGPKSVVHSATLVGDLSMGVTAHLTDCGRSSRAMVSWPSGTAVTCRQCQRSKGTR